tara:strand:- start:273 stop:467 length:195 start_codon:yes stop_codon:yes gene_type:complete
MPNPISSQDVVAINHINYITNEIHNLTDDLYEDLMDRNHEDAKETARKIVLVMNDLIKSMSDEI